MANTEQKYASLETLTSYDKLIKEHISSEIDSAVSTKASSSHTHAISDINDLQNTLDIIDESIDQKSKVQIAESGSLKHIPSLTIHKLTQEEYEQAVANGTIDSNALYLTPDEDVDSSEYVTAEQLGKKADLIHTHKISDVVNLQDALDEVLDESKEYTNIAILQKADTSHSHDDLYYTENEIDEKLSGKSDAYHDHDNDYAAKSHDHNGIYAEKSHNHDDNYATKSHNHNDVYYTETEVDEKLSKKADASHSHDNLYDIKGTANTALESAKTYTDNAVSQKSQVQIITWQDND